METIVIAPLRSARKLLLISFCIPVCCTFLIAQPKYVSFSPDWLSVKRLGIGPVITRATAFTFVNTLSVPVYGVYCTFDRAIQTGTNSFRAFYHFTSLPQGAQTWYELDPSSFAVRFEVPVDPGGSAVVYVANVPRMHSLTP